MAIETTVRTHTLKTDPDVFDAVASGQKTFEIRWNDRNYQVGDELILRKTRYTGEQMIEGLPLEYIGEPIRATVTYILHGPVYGLARGWVIMGITAAAPRPVPTCERLPTLDDADPWGNVLAFSKIWDVWSFAHWGTIAKYGNTIWLPTGLVRPAEVKP